MRRSNKIFFVSKEKVKQYLLNPDHPDGGSKARFFVNCGFDINNWKIFADALCKQAQNHSILETEETPYGTKYVIKGVIHTPSNKNVLIRTVWITKNQRKETELITAYSV